MSNFQATRVETEPAGHEHHHFEQHHVRVTIPKQHDSRKVHVHGNTQSTHKSMRQSDFEVQWHVMNLDLTKDGTDVIEPPAIIRVELASEHIQPGRPLTELLMAYWDDDSNKWVVFTKEKHNFRHIEASAPGQHHALEANLSKWGDPPVAVGNKPPSS